MRIATKMSVLAVAGFMMFSSGTAGQTPSSSEETQALAALVAEFYQACAKKDVDSAIKFWSSKTPDLQPYIRELYMFVSNGELTSAEPKITRTAIAANRASLRAAVEISVEGAGGPGSKKLLLHHFEFARESGAWRISNWLSAVDELVERLLSARPPERQALLSAEKDLIGSELAKSVLTRGAGAVFQGRYDAAFDSYNVALAVADRIHDESVRAYALLGLGKVNLERRDYARSLDSFSGALKSFETLNDPLGAATTLDNLAGLHHARRDYKAATEAYLKALKQYETGDNKTGMATVLESMAAVHVENHDAEAALECLNKSLAIRERLETKAGLAAVLTSIGNVHYRKRRFDLALTHYDRALNHLNERPDDELRAQVMSSMAEISSIRGDHVKAIQSYKKVLEYYEQAGNKQRTADTLQSLGQVLYDQRDFAGALGNFQKSLKLFEELDARSARAGVLSAIGRTHFAQRSYSDATAHYQQALKIFEAQKDRGGVAGALYNLAAVYDAQGNLGSALDYYSSSLKVAEEIGSKADAAAALFGLGRVRTSEGDYQEARACYEKSRKIEESLGNKSKLAAIFNNVALTWYSQADYLRALENYHESLRIESEIGDEAKIAGALGNIGIVHSSAGNPSVALDYYSKALALEEKLGDRAGQAGVLGNISRAHLQKSDFKTSLDLAQRSLAIWEALNDKTGTATALTLIGNIYFGQATLDQALGCYRKALAIYEQVGNKEASAHLDAAIANVYFAQGDNEAALNFSRQTAALASQIGNLEILWYARTKEGAAQRQLNRLAEAKRSLQEAVAIIETIRSDVRYEATKLRFTEGRSLPYLELVDLLVQEANTDEAFRYSELAKIQALADLINEGAVVNNGMTADQISRQRKVVSELVSVKTQLYRAGINGTADQRRTGELMPRLKSAQAQYDGFQRELYAAVPRLQSLRGKMQTAGAKEAAALLQESDALLLEYAITADRVYLFTLDASSLASGSEAAATVKVYQLATNPQQLKQNVYRFREMILNRDQRLGVLARELSETLLGPASSQLEKRARLIIIPDKVLWSLPFQALQPSDNQFLIERAAISLAPSLAFLNEVLRLKKGRPAANSGLIALGSASSSGEILTRLRQVYPALDLNASPDNENEARAVATVHGQADSRVYTGEQANEDRAKLAEGNNKILHIAAPGVIDDANPMHSGVLLSRAPEGREDGMLQLLEIADIGFKPDLVVLSGTTRPGDRQANGEALLAAASSLFAAGCPTLVLSQWRSDPAGSTRLMPEFYRSIKEKNATAESLRRLALAALKTSDYAHPVNWASYTLIGAGY